MRFSRRAGLIILISSLIWAETGTAQNVPATRETLLEALSVLWTSYDRLPSPEEINENGPYDSASYLKEWNDWDAVKQALAEHVYQKGLFAGLQGDKQAATIFYRQALSINPGHEAAATALRSASDIEVDIEEAKTQKDLFTVRKAGAAASESYMNFINAVYANQEQEAIGYYRNAVKQKDAHVSTEIERLQAVHGDAVEAFDKEEYNKALPLFQLLAGINEEDIGYADIVKPNAEEIADYLTQSQIRREGQRVAGVLAVSRGARTSFWLSAGYYALPSQLGFKFSNGGSKAKVNALSYMGADLGVSTHIISNLQAGAIVSLMMNASSIEAPFALDLPVDFSNGSILSLSGFLQPGGFVSDQIRLYSQIGGGIHRINFSRGEISIPNSNTFVPAHSETPFGFFIGVGADLYNKSLSSFVWGFKLDLKYHTAKTKPQTIVNQKLNLNGLRATVGIVFSR